MSPFAAVPRSRTARLRRAAWVLALLVAAAIAPVHGPADAATGAAAATGPSDGGAVTVTSVRSAKLLDVHGASTADNATVIQYTANGHDNQRWTTRSTGGSAYTIVNVHSGKCLAVSGASNAAGAAVIQSSCVTGAAGQGFTFASTGVGGWTVRSVHSGLCLDVTGGSSADGATIEQWTCTGATNQQWLVAGSAGVRVGTWGTAVNPGGAGFTDQTVRETVHTSVAGTAPQLTLSNLFGSGPLAAGHVDVAVQSSGGTAVAGSHHRVTFGGADQLVLAAGAERVGDPIGLTVTANQNLLVSVYVSGSITSSTWHSGATATTWTSSPGDHAAEDGTGNYPTTNTSWFLISGLTVASPTAGGTLVTFGDSITDGYGSTNNADDRYPDYLARRLVAATGGPKLGVVNAGIGGNRVLTDAGNTSGYSALHRFSRDALGRPGVRDVILLEGVNDLRGTSVKAQSIIDAYQTLIAQAHAAGVAVYGGTILPFGGSTGWTAGQDTQRQTINSWIRTSGAFDGVVDFDAAVRDPANQTRILAAYDKGDHLHPDNAGYQAMAGAVDLGILKP